MRTTHTTDNQVISLKIERDIWGTPILDASEALAIAEDGPDHYLLTFFL
jgi:hypothetical protein